LDHWLNDPPDTNYSSLVSPSYVPWDRVSLGAPDVTDFGIHLDRLRALLTASLTTYERYQGARDAGATVYVSAQSGRLSEQLFDAITEIRTISAQIEELNAQLVAGLPNPSDRAVTRDDVAIASEVRA